MSAVPAPVRRAASAAGRRIGRFELKSELGRGAQATVWLAYDPRLQREVAVKIINPDADAASVAQWLRTRNASRVSVGRLSQLPSQSYGPPIARQALMRCSNAAARGA